MTNDDYTTTPTHVRIWRDGREWFLDGVDNDLRYTEECWSFDTFATAIAALPEFVDHADGVTWLWDTQRPSRQVRRTPQGVGQTTP